MGSAAGWLSLKIVDRAEASAPAAGGALPARHRLLISVPKRSVRLAIRRNRIKRLIREAVRLDGLFSRQDRTHLLKVQRDPGAIGLAETRQALREAGAR
ncbi:MAG: Ribonuclease P protein component [Candidatus Omnitrophica bacterium]|nr:Ribonuclease P protein component [Candidatus Omnitrophota bacterium]